MTMLALAYAFIWAAVFVYIILVGRRLARTHAELDDVRRRLTQGKP